MACREKRNNPLGRREADRQSKKSFHLLRAAIEAVADPFIVVGTDFRVKLVNHAARNFCKQGQDAVENSFCYHLIFGLDKPCSHAGRICPLLEVLESEKPCRSEYEHQNQAGETRYYEIMASPLYDEDGDLLGIVESLRDVSERRHLAEILQHGREELEIAILQKTADLRQTVKQAELIFRLIPSATFTVDTNRTITSWNNTAAEVTGYTAEEAIGQQCSLFALNPCLDGCGVFSIDTPKPIVGRQCEIRTKDGRIRIASKNADLLRNPNGRVIGAVESFEDVTLRNEFERQLRTERDKFMSMLVALNQGMHILNRDYGIEYQNDVLKETFGDQVGRRCYEIYKQLDEPCEICRMQEAIETNTVQRTELLMTNDRHYEQSYAPFVDIDGQTKALILLRDITEEKTQQAETMRAAQLASIGELAAGVAHEINNPINGIINYAQILLDDRNVVFKNDDDQQPNPVLHNIIHEGERIAAIVRNLLSFARQGDDEIGLINLDEVITDSIALINHQFLKDGIDIAFHTQESLPQILANRQQLQQVFLNLLSNSRYALNQRYPGKDVNKRISIECVPKLINNREFLRTTLTDWGCGIPNEILRYIFKPFFTLKEPGMGTGLGLSISLKLVETFKGFLTVESEVNNFTRMIVDLPVGADRKTPADPPCETETKR